MKDENGLDVVEKETVQYIVVSIGNEQYGLDISYVDNIVCQRLRHIISALSTCVVRSFH